MRHASDGCRTRGARNVVNGPSRRSCLRCAIGVIAVVGIAPTARAQGNLSTQGFGYPTGQMSTSTLGVGGSLAEFDPLSAVNPAALAAAGRITIHAQYDPEFRTVTTPQGADHTTTARFPLFSLGIPITTRFAVGVSFSTLLDRTWQSTQTGPTAVGDTSITSTENFTSKGGIEDIRATAAWNALSWLQAGVAFHVLTGQNQLTVERTFPDTTVVKALPFLQTTTYSYEGTAVSAGIILRPTKQFSLATSAELGGALRVRRSDTLQSKANAPSRIGAGIRYEGIPGVTIAAQGQYDEWSRMQGLGSSGLQAHDSWTWGAGVDVAGPRLGTDRNLQLRTGVQTRTLPFLANGTVVRENVVAAGVGLPFAFQRAVIDLTGQRAFRSASVPGVSEAAWMLSVGLTIRP